MVITRRGFFGSLLGLVGLGAVSKPSTDEPTTYKGVVGTLELKESVSDAEIERIKRKFEATYCRPGNLLMTPAVAKIQSR
jgi:hypothetical protein